MIRSRYNSRLSENRNSRRGYRSRLNESEIRIIPHDKRQPEYLASTTVDRIVLTASGNIKDYKFEFFVQEENKNEVDVIVQVSDREGYLASYIIHTNSVKKAETLIRSVWEDLEYESDRWAQNVLNKYGDSFA